MNGVQTDCSKQTLLDGYCTIRESEFIYWSKCAICNTSKGYSYPVFEYCICDKCKQAVMAIRKKIDNGEIEV